MWVIEEAIAKACCNIWVSQTIITFKMNIFQFMQRPYVASAEEVITQFTFSQSIAASLGR